MKTVLGLRGLQYKGVQVMTASLRAEAADGTRQELASGNAHEAALEYSGLPSELCPSVSFSWEDEGKGEAGGRKPEHSWVLPAVGSETAGAGTPTTGCAFQTHSWVSSFRYGLRGCFSANNHL